MAFRVDVEPKEQPQTSPQKGPEKSPWWLKVIPPSLIAPVVLGACQLKPIESQVPSSPTTPIAGETLPVEGTPVNFSITPVSFKNGYPPEFSSYADALGSAAKKDGIDPQILDGQWIKAEGPKGEIDYALMPFATVTGLTDPDGKPSDVKPVYYLGYNNGQVNYAVGKLIETDNQGRVSFTARMIDSSVFESWKNNTQASQTKLGQIIYAIPLKEGITVEQARQIQKDFIEGKITQEQLLSQYALGLSFVQPEKPDNFVSIAISAGQPATPEPGLLEQAFNKLLGATPAAAAGLEYSATPAPEPTPVPTIEVNGLQLPDPHITNPELFDLQKQEAPIVEYAKAFNVNPEDVSKGLHLEVEKPQGMPEFITMRTSDGVALIMATKNENGEWVWQKATPGPYWHAQGKVIGVYLDGGEFDYPNNLDIVEKFFSGGGLISLNGQVRPNADRPPSNANSVAHETSSHQMSLFFHYVAEPGKFPSNVNASNIDGWLDSRFEGIVQVIKNHKTKGQPTYVSFNEAWEGNTWNQESNPLKDKYGNRWVEEYTFQLLSKFINSGLVPNKDFFIVFNDANLYNRPNKQDLVFKTLSESRLNAFNRLASDPKVMQKLQEMGINKPEDIYILLGVETHTKLGENIDNGMFVPQPTNNQINTLADKFATMGGIIMTEVNPLGEKLQQEQFLKEIFSLLKTNSNLKGILLWNVFEPDYPEEVLSKTHLNLFDDNGFPTILFFSLLAQ